MASHGPQEIQSDITKSFTDFFKKIADLAQVTNEHQTVLLAHIEQLLQRGDGYALTFNQTIQVNGAPYTAAALIEQHNLAILRSGLQALARQYKVSFEQAAPLLNRVDPTILKQIEDDLVDENAIQYKLIRKLDGRGQPGLACFYMGQDGLERLIKEDDVGTCLMEGTAYYIRDIGLLPGMLAASVNFAKVGTLLKSGERNPSIVSIQDKVMPTEPDGKVRSWDEIVFGAKRQPKTLISSEQWNESAIKENILLLNTEPKWQLAAGILCSAIAGDESLHVGQFMAMVDSKNHVTGIKRIDLGARERYAVSRKASLQDPYNVSSEYRSVGQFGKNYVSYLLAEPSLSKIYTMLWMNLSAVDKIEESITSASKQAFITQLNVIPLELQPVAIEKALDTINKLSKSPFVLDKSASLPSQIVALASHVAELDALRVINMVAVGKRKYAEYQQMMTQKVTTLLPTEQRHLCQEMLKLQELLILARKLSADDLGAVLQKIDALNVLVEALVTQAQDAVTPDTMMKIQLLTEIGADLVQAATLNLQYSPEMSFKYNATMNTQLNKLQTLNELANYCENASTPDKKNKAAMMMKQAIVSDAHLLKYIQNPKLIDEMKAHQSYVGATSALVVGTHTRGELLMMRLFKRYHLDDKLLMMSDAQHKLVSDIQEKNFAKVVKDIKPLTIYDVLQPMQNGKTALHCLMELGGAESGSLNAIMEILKKAVGSGLSARSDLDIPDAKGLTPFDYLMQNENASVIIKHINAQQMKESYSLWAKVLTVDSFFNVAKYPEALQERYHQYVQGASSSYALK